MYVHNIIILVIKEKSSYMNKQSNKQFTLDTYEQDLENNFDLMRPVNNLEKEIALLQQTAKNYIKRKKPVTIRINIADLQAVQLKASKLGIPYQTYINMLIHKNVANGLQ